MTEAIINLRYLAESQPSLCIPRVFNNITEARVRQVFDDLALGKITQIDIKERKNEKGDSFKRVYVHFEKWFWNEDAQAARRKLVSGKEVKIVYDNPWFWKVSASKWMPSCDLHDRGTPHRLRAHIELDDEPCGRVTDEFGRDTRLKSESFDRCSLDRREEPRDNRRHDNRRHYNRKPDDSRDSNSINLGSHIPNNRRRYDSRESHRPDIRDSRHPIVPTLTRKTDRPKEKVVEEKIIQSTTPPTSPPRERYLTKVETPKDEAPVVLNYGNNIPPIPKRRPFGGQKKSFELVETTENVVDVCNNVEHGEMVDETDRVVEMSEEDRNECDDLYGDLY